MSQPTPPRRRRRWFSLSLRGLMLLVLVLGGAMGWKARRASLQRRAVARIEQLGGMVRYDWQGPYNPFSPTMRSQFKGPEWLARLIGDEYFQEVAHVTFFDKYATRIRPSFPEGSPGWQAEEALARQGREIQAALSKDQLACLADLDHLESLELQTLRLDSEGAARLGKLTSLKRFASLQPLTSRTLEALGRLGYLESITVNLDGLNADDPALGFLDRLTNLQALTIDNFEATDATLARIGRLSRLMEIEVYGQAITDAGLAHLAGLDGLDSLVLGLATKIGDAGLAHLSKLDKLEFLILPAATEITDAGLAHLTTLRDLDCLNLGSASKITDAGLTRLEKLPDLSQLHLSAKSLTDAGLNDLRKLTKLTTLSLFGRKIDPEILSRLETALPVLQIEATPTGDDSKILEGPRSSQPPRNLLLPPPPPPETPRR